LQDGLYLPRELIDHILGYLKDDRGSLSACALPSRHWCIPVQTTLFRHFTIRYNHKKSLEDIYDEFFHSKFFSLMVQHIKELTIRTSIASSVERKCRIISALDVDGLLSKFPAVRKLTLI